MAKKEFKKGDLVFHERYGKGQVISVEYVETPSDDDHTMLVVKMDDGSTRHFKSYQLDSQ